MKVNESVNSKVSKKKPVLSKADIEAKIKAKFGDVKKKKEAKKTDKVELSSKEKGVKSSKDKDFGDVKGNSPDSEETREKLRGILKAGAFEFSDKERRALGQILK